MFCAVANDQALPENLDKLTKLFNEKSIPLQKKWPGFRGVYLVAKPSGEFMILGMWDSEEQANAWLASPEHIALGGQVDALTIRPPDIGSYNVLAYDV